MLTLDFEEPVLEIEKQIESLGSSEDSDRYADEITQLRQTRDRLLAKTYASLTPLADGAGRAASEPTSEQ